ncbi:CinA family protein [Amphiplicatus metriothermophilus]|uniref:Nicotinamide-nucleotide amidase n=1 Tax=Amphiplicatus metriothermophilus TaxID=1519374 RepID=A0A239PXF4_9PROT|nr:nicotinamide-nucleotide amidohydrolase family protein [Amphiplicatus metriothermophilus]MBB5519959.1 nicotinamide-nucleotide amidase [Amphiplicatus metriothermophilus]SNT74860.1 nicotinamide-nucleotide amidase [Amphiplicatus metriothermophilus]
MAESARIAVLARTVIQKAAAKGLMIATAESCTGGMIAAALTDIPGSSAAFERGFVTYSNQAKTELLGVASSLIAAHGAVSAAVARAMAEGARARSHADIAVSVTGVAGPDGGTPEKPVGLVWFGLAARGGGARVERRLFARASRAFVRAKSVETALFLLAAAAQA